MGRMRRRDFSPRYPTRIPNTGPSRGSSSCLEHGCCRRACRFCRPPNPPIPTAKAVLTVTVVNETRGGAAAPAGTEVILRILDGEQPVDMKSAVIDDKGVCVFADLPVGATLSAQAQTQYGNMAFSSAPVALVPSQNRFELSLPVFDVSFDRSAIHAGTHHIILRRNSNRLAITEYLQLVNDSDKAVLSERKDPQGKPVVMEIDLPAGFRELSFSSYFHPDAVVITPSGFYDTMAIPPGRNPAVYSYALAVRGSTMDIAKKITIPTKEVMIFAQLDGAAVAGLGPSQGKMTLQRRDRGRVLRRVHWIRQPRAISDHGAARVEDGLGPGDFRRSAFARGSWPWSWSGGRPEEPRVHKF